MTTTKKYKILEKYYGPENFNEGRKKMAMLPDKALLIFNPSSGAPGFIVENVHCLPGVPSILKSMLGGLNNKIIGGNKKNCNLLNKKEMLIEFIWSDSSLPTQLPSKHAQNISKFFALDGFYFFEFFSIHRSSD